ncbi:uncharacterized protein M421DRAFT_404860 [Didymella exigua CBS 183.55]|uniref:Zn(2)-C6 fungal-type domain-containing protein n=1 Tax=Didymella exigua CBS 183.55 TaxID=1150837 RepID=A0A6A5R6W3_9PLEO|nr:uncharacterized protein M421DRAFT_404860 [Didymella exigua CBS 183.55]KAF1923885.1 hypothetical protein M421DRAFT_404860 [Didymella exigua CBS 183.55]
MDLSKQTLRPQRPIFPKPPHYRKNEETCRVKLTKRSSACGECRARKTKCDGARPKCQACVPRETACDYRLTESRQVRMHRSSMQEKKRAEVSHELLQLMKSSSDNDAINILLRLRAGADPEAVVRQVKDGNLLMQLSLVPETRRRYDLPYITEMPAFLLTPENPYKPPSTFYAQLNLQDPGISSCYTKPYHAAVVFDALVDKVTISTWTTIISSDELLRQLLRSFFQHAYAEWFPFHKDLFLSDMVANRTQFCSPLLVNAVLANACYSSSSLHDRAKYWIPDNLTYKFTAEAKRLWDVENASGRRCLTTIQASQILSVIMDFNGINALGRTYTNQGLNMACDLDLFRSIPEGINEQMRKARIWTAWSLYAWHSMISYYFHQSPRILEPPAEPLPENPQWYGEIYLQYPPNEKLIPMRLNHSFRTKCQLRSIKSAISQRAFDDTNLERGAWLTPAETNVFCSKLNTWFETLPEHLNSSRVVFPKDIGTHLEYLSVITDLLLPGVSEDMEYNALTRESPTGASIESPAMKVLNANRSKETLLRSYFLRHSFDNFDPMLVNFIIERLGASIADLGADHPAALHQRLPVKEILRSTLILCATGLRAQARNYCVCNLAYYGLQSQMRPEDLQLLLTYAKPPEETDMPPSDHDAVTSWPLPIIRMSEDPKKSALSKMVKDYHASKGGTDSRSTFPQACPLSAICD